MQPIPEPGVGDGPPHAEQAEEGVPHSASDIIVEWMWGDAGTALTRPLAQMNPLRWHSGSLQAVAADLQGRRSGEEVRRPVDVRVKTGAAQVHSFESPEAAVAWLTQLAPPGSLRLEAGAERQRMSQKQAKLCSAALDGNTSRVLQHLRAGASVNGETLYGKTPLCCAAWADGDEGTRTVMALIDRGADPNLPQSSGGQTPLCHAASRGNMETVVALIQAGARPTQANTVSGKTPRDLALKKGYDQVANMLESAEDLVAALGMRKNPAAAATQMLNARQPGHADTVAALVRGVTDPTAAVAAAGSLLALDLSNQRLAALPAGVLALRQLRWLSLRDNYLTELPLELTHLRRLTALDLAGNPRLRDVAAIASDKGVSAVFEYLRDLHDDPQPTFKLKLLVVGPSMAGKTSAVNRLMGLPDKDVLADVDSRTIGLDIVPDVVLHDPQGRAPSGIVLVVYDAGGHEEYQEIQQVFVTPDALNLLLWDLSKQPQQGQDEQAFQREMVTQLVHWALTIQSCAPGSTVCTVGNLFALHSGSLNLACQSVPSF